MSSRNRTDEQAAKATGYSATKLREARAVKQAAEADPELKPVSEEMCRTGNVHAAFREVSKRKRRTKEELEAERKKKTQAARKPRHHTPAVASTSSR